MPRRLQVAVGSTWSGTSIPAENALAGEDPAQVSIGGAGDTTVLGFARPFNVNVGQTVGFCCHGTGTILDIYRIGWYGGAGWRKIVRLTNTATSQPDPVTITGSNGGVEGSNWTPSCTWAVPAGAVSGLYVGVYRNAAANNASYIPFVVTDDARPADIIVKTSDATWAAAYNYYATPASPLTGKSLYGSGGALGDITTRTHCVSYERPIITRDGVPQTYWLNSEAPLIRWLERMGYSVKYVSCRDVDARPTCLDGAKIIVSIGHDEYWSQPMRDAFLAARDSGKHLLFASGNEAFWRTRYDGHRMWCFKDTMAGPGAHTAGTALDPVSWTGTWRDTRWASRAPERLLTGTEFRMNGVINFDAVIPASFGTHPVWRNTTLSAGALTLPAVIGFEADQLVPAQPSAQQAVLGSMVQNIDGRYADDNGENYSGSGSLNPWGVVAQRYASGAVVVGFGTCQWSWLLDATHDRSGSAVSLPGQQMTTNLLTDLGARPASPHAGLVVSGPAPLAFYGALP